MMGKYFTDSIINWTESIQTKGTSHGITCPYCKTFAAHSWVHGLPNKLIFPDMAPMYYVIILAICQSCGKGSYWLSNSSAEREEVLLFPNFTSGYPEPNIDMPPEIETVYFEAAKVIDDSPRASAALTRLAIDKLTSLLEPEGKDINQRIGNLVKQGLPVEIQQSLDIVRVIGNNAVHPGEIDLTNTDNKDIASSLLELLNIIVDNRISQPRKISEMYNNLPKGALKAIEKRDSKT